MAVFEVEAWQEAQSVCRGLADESRIAPNVILTAVALDLTPKERKVLRRLLQLARCRREGG